MDLRDSPEEEKFRLEVRAWLAENAPPKPHPERGTDEWHTFHRPWHRKLSDAGYAGLSWPVEYGGRGGTPSEQVIFEEELGRAGAPGLANHLGIFHIAPAIMVYGTEEQKRRYLPKILSAEEIWCQGFSEPGAGSDLGGLRSTAILDGDSYIINGQKVWTSLAHLASWCIFLARTDTTAPKHKGITYFLVDMRSPGVEVRPLKQITGSADFNEMFFTDVRVPRENVLGEINDGWRVAMTTLLHERGTLGFALSVGARVALDELIRLARETKRYGKPAFDDPTIRQRLASLHVEVESLRLNMYRSLTSVMRTGIPGPEGSLGKLIWSESMQRLGDLAVEILGPAGMLERWTDNPSVQTWQYIHLRSRGHTIEAGTSEILRNIVAERVLGLPKHK